MSRPKRIAHADLEQFFLDALAAVDVPPHVAAVEAQIGAEGINVGAIKCRKSKST